MILKKQFIMQIRLANNNDAVIISNFNKAMAFETEHKILNDFTALNGVNNLLLQPQFGFYVVAEIDCEIVGSLMITYEWSDWRNGLIWWLQSVFVKNEQRKKNVFKNMLLFVEQHAKKNNALAIRLYMEKENETAHKTYNRCGFQQTDYLIFEKLIE